VGQYCHACGQARIMHRLTLREFYGDLLRRVLRFDRALLTTFGRALRDPGTLAEDYLGGRRKGLLDPIHYYVSSIFVQLIAAALTRAIAPLLDRTSALNWLGTIGGIVAFRMVVALWMGTLWRALYGPMRHNLAEALVFSIYAFGTIGNLWALLPLIDLAVPFALGTHRVAIVATCLSIELAYLTFGVQRFGGHSLRSALWRVALVLGIGYATLYLVASLVGLANVMLPPVRGG
jgi:hypothetical protein